MDPNTISPPPQQNAPAPLFQTPSLPPEMPGQPRKKSKMLFIFGGVLIVFVLIIIAAVLLAGSGKKSNDGTTPNNTTYNASSEAVTQSEAFLALLSDGKTEEAITVFKPAQQTKQQFTDRVATVSYLKANYPVNECQTNGSTTQDTVVVYTCKNSSNKEITIEFTARKIDGKTVLSDLIILNETSAS